jgi:hypothetical protein
MVGMLIAFFGIFFIFWGGLAILIVRAGMRRTRRQRAMWGAGSAGYGATWFDSSGGGGGHHSGCGGGGSSCGGGGGGCGGGGSF